MTPATATFVLVPQHFGCVLFDRARVRYLPFDRAGSELLAATARLPLRAVLAALPDAERPAAAAFFEHFYDEGLFDIGGRLLGVALEVTDLPADHLLGPLVTHLEVVAACNLTCTHCFAGTLPRPGRLLDLSELERLFAELAAVGCFRLNLTGGEPLLRRDLLELIELARAAGLHCTLTSNGLLLDERLARAFGQREDLRLNLSLDGATAATHDAVRGPGSFAALLERLALLRRHARFGLAFTVGAHNAHEVADFVALSRRLGADAAVVRPLYPTGEALRHPELIPTLATWSQAASALARLGLPDAGAELCGLDPRPATHELGIPANAGCSAGRLQCSISAHGALSPCSFLGPDFEAGSVRERSFAALWRESQRFRLLREVAGRVDGCRARGLHLGGSLEAPDPWEEAWRQEPGRAPALGTALLRPRERPLPLVRETRY
ncbi:MAG: radical SAM/SPASM domain-containing protein [Planctomycetota bacterium]